jgi:large subunit ribosomal protein L31
VRHEKGIHPDYHFVTVVLNDGTRTGRARPGRADQADAGHRSDHAPGVTGGQQSLRPGGRLTRFNKKFKDFVKGSSSTT